MQKYETVNYENMEKIYIQKNINTNNKVNSKFSLFLFEYCANLKTKELKFITDNRPMSIKNILCFYSVYFLYSKNEVRHLSTNILKQVEKSHLNGLNGNSNNGSFITGSYKYKTLNEYGFFLSYKVKELAGNQTFLVQTNTNKEFKIKVNITEITKMTIFEVEKDLRELSAYAYDEAYKYMIANTKQNSERFKIIKNSIYFKKFNFNEDKSIWESWTIRFRKCHISKLSNNNNMININYINNNKNVNINKISPVKNYAFIFLRRKFLFPYYDTFRNFCVILEEESRESDFDFSKEAVDVLELAADSLATTHKLPEYFKSILEAKLNSLLLDEETLTFCLNNLKINEVEIIWIGFAFVYFLLKIVKPKNEDDESWHQFEEWGYILSNCWARMKHSFSDDNTQNSLEEL
jgi:hypothetical protein